MSGRARLLAGVLLIGSFIPRVAMARRQNGSDLTFGVESRSLTFDSLPGLRQLRQFAWPLAFSQRFGRLAVEFGTSWVSTSLRRRDGTRHYVDDFTDSQVSGVVTLGRDAAVATVVVNLPTGPTRASARDYTVIGAVSPGFLAFPVASYSGGFSVTGGLAVAIPAGTWSLGLAGSVRANSSYTPYSDAVGDIVYKPGIEARLRAGADGLLGSSRLSLGLTWSTFGDDQFGVAGGVRRGAYHPGTRWLGEAGLVSPVGGSTLSLSFWDFYRTAGDSTGTSAANRENLAAAEAVLSVPLSGGVTLEPEGSWRASKPQKGSSHMLGGGLGLRVRLGEGVTLAPEARYDGGITRDGLDHSSGLHGWSFSAFLRAAF